MSQEQRSIEERIKEAGRCGCLGGIALGILLAFLFEVLTRHLRWIW